MTKKKKRGCLLGCLKVVFLFFLSVPLFFYFYIVLPIWGIPFNASRHTRVPITPAWALECWLWEDDHNTAERVEELLQGYAEKDIPVRTVILDSPWSTRYNDYVVDEDRYPNPKEWFQDLENRGYRMILWTTCMVNSENDDTAIQDARDWFEKARQAGYLAGKGEEWKWWKGRGGFVDYTDPEAMEWWRGMQQTVFDYGIDGWKLDGCATFFNKPFFKVPLPYQRVNRGWMTTRGYMDHYYREEYRHGLTENPQFVTLARAVDRPFLHPEGYAPLDAAPVTWVGDQRHAWKSGEEGALDATHNEDEMVGGEEGIEEALRDILYSAKLGYCVIGSDVAGFSGSTIPPRLYIRWAQMSCFCGLFMNGGHGERALWKRSQEELEIIRKFSWLHTELIPYMYSYVVSCHDGGRPLQVPTEGKYHYLFGDDFLIAPIYKDSLINEVCLPSGRWRYFFDDDDVLEGPQSFSRKFSLDEYPVYVRDGAIIPLRVTRSYTGFGDESSEGYLTFLIYPHGKNTFTVHHTDGSGKTTVLVEETHLGLTIQLGGLQLPHKLCIFSDKCPAQVELDDQLLEENSRWTFEKDRNRIWIMTQTYPKGDYQVAFGRG